MLHKDTAIKNIQQKNINFLVDKVNLNGDLPSIITTFSLENKDIKKAFIKNLSNYYSITEKKEFYTINLIMNFQNKSTWDGQEINIDATYIILKNEKIIKTIHINSKYTAKLKLTAKNLFKAVAFKLATGNELMLKTTAGNLENNKLINSAYAIDDNVTLSAYNGTVRLKAAYSGAIRLNFANFLHNLQENKYFDNKLQNTGKNKGTIENPNSKASIS